MSAIPDASSSPTLAERWIKANIVAAIISGVASFAVYAVKHAVGAAEPQAEFGALLVLYIATTAFSGFAGAAGADHSAMLMLPVVRSDGDHALLVAGQLANKERPYVRVEFPLTAGAIAPADLSGYTGVSFDVRGEAVGRLLVQAYHVRSTDAYAAPFIPGGQGKAF